MVKITKHILDTMSQFYFTFNKKFPLNRRIITRFTRLTRTRGVLIRVSKTWGSRTRVSRCGAVSPGDTGGWKYTCRLPSLSRPWTPLQYPGYRGYIVYYLETGPRFQLQGEGAAIARLYLENIK